MSRVPDIDELRPWLAERFDRSGGPGGQNVNKVASRATLLFDFESCAVLSEFQRSRIRERLATRLDRAGRLRIVSQTERSQGDNRAQAEQRMLELLAAAFKTQTPRRPTRPTLGGRKRRLGEKRARSELKRQRQSRPPTD